MNENDLLPCPCGAPAEFSGLNAANQPCPACTVCSFRTLSIIDWNTRSSCVVLPKPRSDNEYIHEPLAAAGYNECIQDTKTLNNLMITIQKDESK